MQAADSVAKTVIPADLLLLCPDGARASIAQQLANDLHTDESKTSTADCCSLYVQDTNTGYVVSTIVVRFISAYLALGQ